MESLKILCHRGLWDHENKQNSIDSFKNAFRLNFGIELDIRDSKSRIVVSHDMPLSTNELFFEEVLDCYVRLKHKNVIAINIKSDGLIEPLRILLNDYGIVNYFAFDMSVPEMLCYRLAGIKYFSRLSEYEGKPSLLDNAEGIWLDAFEADWYENKILNSILKYKKTICFVSNELHGRAYQSQWSMIRKFTKNNYLIICTDKPYEAREFFK